jgi:peptide/nickel transport system substrate-binding protein
MAYYGLGWTYSPDFMPTGDTLFLCGSVANIGGYCSQTNDAMIDKTLTSSNLQYMYTWQDYLTQQLPEIWSPYAASQLTEIANNLKGALPQSSTLSINPENWYFVK